MLGQSVTPAPAGGTAWTLLGGMIGGTVGFGVIIFAHEFNTKYVAIALMAALTLMIRPLVGNLRLFSLYMILMLAPLSLRMSFLRFPHMGGAGAMFIEAVDPFMLLLLYYQARDRLNGIGHLYRFPPACALWTALIVLGIGTVLFGPLRTTAANEVVRMLKLLLLALLIVNELILRRQFQQAVIALMLGVILQSIIALTQYLLGAQLGLGFLGESSDEDIKVLSEGSLSTREFVYRVGGLLGHANLLAGYLALLLPAAVALLLARVSLRLKLLLTAALLVGQLALVLTLSRTGWVDFSVAFVIVLALGASHPVSRKRFMLARGVIIVATVAIALALSPKIIQRLTEADPNSVEYRIKWLKTARAMIIDNPVFGTGLNTYVFAQLPYADQKTPLEMTEVYGDYWPVVHNSWMITWAEQGTVGFLIYVAMHIAVIVVGLRNLRIRDPMMHALSVGLLAGFVGIMIDGLASFFVRQEAPARMFWIALGLILAIDYWRRNNEESISPVAGRPSEPDKPAIESDGGDNGRWLPYRESILR